MNCQHYTTCQYRNPECSEEAGGDCQIAREMMYLKLHEAEARLQLAESGRRDRVDMNLIRQLNSIVWEGI